jgi:hypothetical protein
MEFGLIRTDALSGTASIAPYGGSDKALLADLALTGPFISIRELLFFNRNHHRRFCRQAIASPDIWLVWLAPDSSGKKLWHTWTMYRELFRMIPRRVADRKERLRCYGHLLRWLSVNNNLRDLIHDGLWVVNPRIVTALRALKRLRLARWFTATLAPSVRPQSGRLTVATPAAASGAQSFGDARTGSNAPVESVTSHASLSHQRGHCERN